ncbi:MAG: NAD-dependent epimerase/dehydratase family protein [Gemmatimonadetes bacterium]|nr:NAD-dependent epimerase/dehydratase family protein [Gemmatimonadota bacterium]
MTERALVTGGAGFIGSHVADAYLARGWSVTVLDDLSSGRRENVPGEADFVQCGVNDPEARELLRNGDFDVLNHHAAQLDVRVSVSDPLMDERVNIAGLLNLLEGARGGGVRRVIFASSGGVVYGEGDALPHPEEALKLPVSPYGVSKLASEYYLAMYARLHGLDVVSLRYANVYGPRQNPHGEAGVVAIFCNKILKKDSLTVFGDGSQTRDYVYVEDVARANVAAANHEVGAFASIDDLAFNVGTGIETSVNDLARTLLTVVGANLQIARAPARAGELARSAVNPAKLARQWDWTPQVDLAEGLQRTYDWIATYQ